MKALIFGSLALACSVACANVRYVDWKNGVDDSARDAQAKETAWKTLEFALSKVVDHDEIVMMKGTHNIWQYPCAKAAGAPGLTIDRPLTIRGEGESDETVLDAFTYSVPIAITGDGAVFHSLTLNQMNKSNSNIFSQTGDSVVSNVVFREFTGSNSTRIHAANGLITHCRIVDNGTATTWMTAQVVLEGTVCMENCYVANNFASKGAIVQLNSEGAVLRNCTIVDNRVMINNSGAVLASAAAGCYNNLIWDNVDGSQHLANWSGDTSLTANWIANCTSPTTGLLGEGNTDGDPRLLENRLDISNKSSCKGKAVAALAPAYDFWGMPRGEHPSIGAVEPLDAGGLELTLTASVTFVRRPAELTVSVSVDNDYEEPLTYAWDLYGTGETDATTASAVLTEFGAFRPKVTVTDKNGKTGTESFSTDLVVHPEGRMTCYVDWGKGADVRSRNAMTKDTSWKTLEYALTRVADNDEIVMMKGAHPLYSYACVGFGMKIDRPLTIRGEGERDETVLNSFTYVVPISIVTNDVVFHSLTLLQMRNNGGDIFSLADDSVVSNVVFTDFSGSNSVRIHATDGLLTHCWITGSKEVWNTALVLLEGTARMENCYVANNVATKLGVVRLNGEDAVLRNCTIVDNTTKEFIDNAVVASAAAGCYNNIIWNNRNTTSEAANWAGADFTGLWRGNCTYPKEGLLGSRNIDADPLLVGETPWKIAKESPCRNHGVDDEAAGTTDLCGLPRKFGRHVDIGCSEVQWAPGMALLLR